MAAEFREKRLVDDIDSELYYREMIGCKVTEEHGGKCAAVHCSTGDSYVCQDPKVKMEETTGVGCGGPECEEC